VTDIDSYHRQLCTQHARMLANLAGLLQKAADFAAQRKFPESALLADRIAPDMHPLTVQVRIAADTARLGAARLAGKLPPEPPPLEESCAGLIRYVRHAIDHLGSFVPSDFADADGRSITFPWKPGAGLSGRDYFFCFVVPNVYFHVAAVYTILRGNGLDIGKADFLGELPFVAT
jgi:uncharacterized protein